jgi:hypothetical protein
MGHAMSQTFGLVKIGMFSLMLNSGVSLLQGGALPAFFAHEGTKYTIKYAFTSTCSESMLLSICYDFGHVVDFAREVHTTISLVDSHDTWHTVAYEYHYLLYRSRSTYIKRLVLNESKVTFEMIEFDQNIKILPNVTVSAGCYEIGSEDGKRKVTYLQQTELDSELSGLCLRSIVRRTECFLRNLKDYVEKHETDSNKDVNRALK